jgi:hypothetical protein
MATQNNLQSSAAGDYRVLRDKFGWDGYRLHFARLEL